MSFPIRCRACGAKRPFELVIVKTIDRSAEDGLPVDSWVENFQHCSDNPACVEAAKKWDGYR